ncbi:MarR family transcriptional regulator [Enterococcus sp. 5H]|uniref:MarR family transcriptional regulator n=1 Tax=Enterococcus sp. 5H TaxID=1229490 RepID=UPI002302A8B4|nr:MarR family transcriptional regulator [Enterococcus sp. 5H]MDA9470074.1 Transcriptional regulator, MarR family [Enterococcus sp. 5H]
MDKKDQVLLSVRELFNKKSWLDKLKMEEQLNEYKPSEVHCIEFIGKNKDTNVTKLAESLFMTRGAISKITKKLLKKGSIESYQKADNKKEIYFKLTEQGKVVFNTHEKLHQEIQARDEAVFNQITDKQYNAMLVFLENYSHHLDKEIEKLNIDRK